MFKQVILITLFFFVSCVPIMYSVCRPVTSSVTFAGRSLVSLRDKAINAEKPLHKEVSRGGVGAIMILDYTPKWLQTDEVWDSNWATLLLDWNSFSSKKHSWWNNTEGRPTVLNTEITMAESATQLFPKTVNAQVMVHFMLKMEDVTSNRPQEFVCSLEDTDIMAMGMAVNGAIQMKATLDQIDKSQSASNPENAVWDKLVDTLSDHQTVKARKLRRFMYTKSYTLLLATFSTSMQKELEKRPMAFWGGPRICGNFYAHALNSFMDEVHCVVKVQRMMKVVLTRVRLNLAQRAAPTRSGPGMKK